MENILIPDLLEKIAEIINGATGSQKKDYPDEKTKKNVEKLEAMKKSILRVESQCKKSIHFLDNFIELLMGSADLETYNFLEIYLREIFD